MLLHNYRRILAFKTKDTLNRKHTAHFVLV